MSPFHKGPWAKVCPPNKPTRSDTIPKAFIRAKENKTKDQAETKYQYQRCNGRPAGDEGPSFAFTFQLYSHIPVDTIRAASAPELNSPAGTPPNSQRKTSFPVINAVSAEEVNIRLRYSFRDVAPASYGSAAAGLWPTRQ